MTWWFTRLRKPPYPAHGKIRSALDKVSDIEVYLEHKQAIKRMKRKHPMMLLCHNGARITPVAINTLFRQYRKDQFSFWGRLWRGLRLKPRRLTLKITPPQGERDTYIFQVDEL